MSKLIEINLAPEGLGPFDGSEALRTIALQTPRLDTLHLTRA